MLTQSECEPLSQSGCSLSLLAVRAWRLLPVKLGVSAAASARKDSSSGFIYFFPLFCLGTLGTFSLSSRFFFQLTSSLSSPPCPFTHSAVCVSIAASHQINLHLPQPPGHSITNFTSRLCLSADGFEVCCEMCGWGKKIFSTSKKKMITYHFFRLGSQPVEMDLLSAVSPSVSRKDFFF